MKFRDQENVAIDHQAAEERLKLSGILLQLRSVAGELLLLLVGAVAEGQRVAVGVALIRDAVFGESLDATIAAEGRWQTNQIGDRIAAPQEPPANFLELFAGIGRRDALG